MAAGPPWFLGQMCFILVSQMAFESELGAAGDACGEQYGFVG